MKSAGSVLLCEVCETVVNRLTIRCARFGIYRLDELPGEPAAARRLEEAVSQRPNNL